ALWLPSPPALSTWIPSFSKAPIVGAFPMLYKSPIETAAKSQPNERALQRMAAVRPQWTAVKSAREALGLEGRVLLHAGPPLQDPTRPPIPMLNSAVLSCLHEGWARTPDE